MTCQIRPPVSTSKIHTGTVVGGRKMASVDKSIKEGDIIERFITKEVAASTFFFPEMGIMLPVMLIVNDRAAKEISLVDQKGRQHLLHPL